MAELAVCGGSVLRGLELSLPDARYLQRHGDATYVLPHRIDHLANMRELAEDGCERVLGIASVGGLRSDLRPGALLCPDDFIAFGAGAPAFGDERAHSLPGFDADWRRRVIVAWRDRIDSPLVDGGVYWQTRGPRLETPAEIRFMEPHAHVVGMTIASECIAASDLGLAYAAICVVDNLANGVGDDELTMDDLIAERARNREAMAEALGRLLPALA
ncbi:MAG: MTAP family purine nucleoside phosphorylase [Solirubrobacterales bacterium]